MDGKENRAGTYGFCCNIDRNENGRYTKVLRSGIGEDITKPEWCGLKEEKKGYRDKEKMIEELISRNAVMDYLREQQANVIMEKNKNGFVPVDVCDGMISAIDAFMNFILQVPAAYDVNKVIEGLEVNSMYAQADDEPFVMLDDAVEIVKSGGIE